MEDNFNNFKLKIPADVKTRLELINGIGIKELISIGISFAISSVIGLILNAIFDNFLITISIVFIATVITFACVMKDKNNQSIAGIIVNMINFAKKQKLYKYTIKEDIYNVKNYIKNYVKE